MFEVIVFEVIRVSEGIQEVKASQAGCSLLLFIIGELSGSSWFIIGELLGSSRIRLEEVLAIPRYCSS